MEKAEVTTTKTLIIGCHTGGIGDHIATMYRGGDTYRPTVRELDVTSPVSANIYMRDNGPFDRIIYTAGYSRLDWIDNLTKERFDQHMAVNAYGILNVLRAHRTNTSLRSSVKPVRVAVVVSDAAHTPMRGSVAYTASKAAAEMVVRNAARELFPDYVVVGVSPGVVEGTRMTEYVDETVLDMRGWTPEQARAYENSSSVLGRRVRKSEVSNVLLMAVEGPEALNGSILTINGGK